MPARRPLLLLDVDGVLNPTAARTAPPEYGEHVLLGVRVRLDPWHGGALRAMAGRFDLAWLTGWGGQANALVAPVLGLPALPVAPFAFGSPACRWPAARAYAGDRPLAWLDADPDGSGEAWAASRDHAVPTLLVRTDPAVGLRPEHLARLAAFADALEAGR